MNATTRRHEIIHDKYFWLHYSTIKKLEGFNDREKKKTGEKEACKAEEENQVAPAAREAEEEESVGGEKKITIFPKF